VITHDVVSYLSICFHHVSASFGWCPIVKDHIKTHIRPVTDRPYPAVLSRSLRTTATSLKQSLREFLGPWEFHMGSWLVVDLPPEKKEFDEFVRLDHPNYWGT
jgi:hypothetical protein